MRILRRREFLRTGACALGAAAAACGARGEAVDERPNIVVVLMDDLGFGDLAYNGGADLRTPNIDRLAASGMRLDRFYASCTVCSPTRAALLTGRYPDLVGVPGVIRTHPENSWGRLADDAVLLPAVLHRAGYATAIVGKWHLGLGAPDLPRQRGFDRFRGFLGDMMDDYETHLRHGVNYMRDDEREVAPAGHATDLFTRWAVEYIRGRKAEAQPFFLYLAYNAPHTPIQPPAEWLKRVRERAPDLDPKRAALVALIEHADDGIGRVLNEIATLKRPTLVVFTSDNGGDLPPGARNGPNRGGKGDFFEGGLRVAACAAWPGRIAAGSRCDRVLLTMDLFPTLAEAAGAAFRHEIDGRSFLPELLGRAQPEEPRTLFWMRREGGKYKGGIYHAARRGDWKLVQQIPGGPFALYNLREDPMEQRDLGEAHPKHAQLRAALEAHIRAAEKIPWQPRPA